MYVCKNKYVSSILPVHYVFLAAIDCTLTRMFALSSKLSGKGVIQVNSNICTDFHAHFKRCLVYLAVLFDCIRPGVPNAIDTPGLMQIILCFHLTTLRRTAEIGCTYLEYM